METCRSLHDMDVAPVLADPPGADLPVLQWMRHRNATCGSARPIGQKVMQAIAGREASRHLWSPAVDDIGLESCRGEPFCGARGNNASRAHAVSVSAGLHARTKPA